MTIREFLQKKCKPSERVTFIITRSVKDDDSPYYHSEYRTTPIRTAEEWLEGRGFLDAYFITNADHPPIDVNGHWGTWYKRGDLRCAMVSSEEELIKQYGEKQGREMIERYLRVVQ